MQQRVQSVYQKSGQTNLCELFGYTTKGIPGVEIIGLGNHGRLFKEKLMFLTKALQLKVPKRRFVLCLEFNEKLTGSKALLDYGWLELPLLVLYMSLSGHLPIHKLEACFCAGKVDLSGRFTDFPLSRGFFERHRGELNKRLIVTQDDWTSEEYKFLSLTPLLQMERV